MTDTRALNVGCLLVLTMVASLSAQTRSRGRDLGIPFPGQTGPNNAITDVAGICRGTRDAD